jgi:hypothetical protein
MNHNPLIDATPTREHLRELATGGFPAVWIADRIGMSRNSIIAIRSGRQKRVRSYAARAIARLHAELQGANPTDHGITKHAATIAGWLPVFKGWDAA